MENNVTLPDHIIEEILLKLRVKCLLRFKSVCKSWFYLISDPRFAKLHYDLGAGSTHQLLVKTYCETNSIDIESSLHDDSTKVLVKVPYPSPFDHINGIINFVGSCRGLLLLTTVSSDFVVYFMIWNPSTGLRKRFNKVVPILTYLYGIGYDASTDDYVVVMIRLDKEVHCFSLRSNSWSCIEGTVPLPYVSISYSFSNGSYLNGALHWLVYSYDYHFKVIAFDLVQRRLSEIPLPPQFGESPCYLNVMGGCLCLFPTNCMPAQIWIMKEYKVQSSWTPTIVLDAPYCFRPICFTKNGEILGYNNEDKMLMRLTDKGKLLEKRRSLWNKFVMYKESLLSLSSLPTKNNNNNSNSFN